MFLWTDGYVNAPQSSEVFAEGKWQDMVDLVKARYGAKVKTAMVGGVQKMIIIGGYDINGNKLPMTGNEPNSVEELLLCSE